MGEEQNVLTEETDSLQSAVSKQLKEKLSGRKKCGKKFMQTKGITVACTQF